MKFPSKERLNSHRKKHCREKPFACKLCKSRYNSNSNLTRHVNAKHQQMPDSYKCEICDKSFKYKSSLSHHTETKHSQATLPCNICFKIFITPDELVRHKKLSHTLEKKDFCCRHPGCEFTCNESREIDIHHNRYFRYCVPEKNQIRQEIKKCKGKITAIYKENL